jgi:hypothetical protein
MVEQTHRAGTRESERARERGEEVRWWSGILEGLYRGPGVHRGGVTAGS